MLCVNLVSISLPFPIIYLFPSKFISTLKLSCKCKHGFMDWLKKNCYKENILVKQSFWLSPLIVFLNLEMLRPDTHNHVMHRIAHLPMHDPIWIIAGEYWLQYGESNGMVWSVPGCDDDGEEGRHRHMMVYLKLGRIKSIWQWHKIMGTPRTCSKSTKFSKGNPTCPKRKILTFSIIASQVFADVWCHSGVTSLPIQRVFWIGGGFMIWVIDCNLFDQSSTVN